MAMFAEPIMTIAMATSPAEPTTRAVSHPRQRSTTVRTNGASRPSHPVDVLASTEQLLRQRNDLPAEHPGRAKLRTRAIEKNLPMAKQLARRYAGRGELLDDLAQVAALALIKAIDGYDPSRQIPFVGYAIPSILGALKRHFRDSAWAMRVPRATQELARQVTTATGELTRQRSRPPTHAELADHMHVTIDELRTAIGAWQVYRLASLDTNQPGTDIASLIDPTGGIDPRYARVDDQMSLRPLLAALPLRERRILTMRFDGYMTQTQIAAEIGLSQMHVSRLLRQSLARLRAGISN